VIDIFRYGVRSKGCRACGIAYGVRRPACRQAGTAYRVFGLLICFFVFACSVLGMGQAFAQEGEVMKKVVIVIAQDGFRDEELFQPKEILEKEKIQVKIASSSLKEARGMLGARVKPDILINDVNMQDFDGIIFIGGRGASQYWDNPFAHKLAQEAIALNKVVGALCIAPVTLAKAGILKGKKATVWPSEGGQLQAAGAIYTGRAVEEDGNIITADGPSSSTEFGQAVLRAIKY
jgi:protease I